MEGADSKRQGLRGIQPRKRRMRPIVAHGVGDRPVRRDKMRLKRVFCTIGLLLLLGAFSASASQLTDVGLQSKDNATTLTIRANGAFTHTEYRPTQNLLLVDLAGVSAAKLENKSRDLHGQFPGVESYHVLGYK